MSERMSERLLKRQKKLKKQLYRASKKGNVSQVLRFLDAAAANGTTSKKLLRAHFGDLGSTALHEACANGHFKVIKALLRANANLEAKDNDGDTPLHVAVDEVEVEIAKFASDGAFGSARGQHSHQKQQRNDAARQSCGLEQWWRYRHE